MPGKVKGLCLWCQNVTEGYDGVQVRNMTSSWKNGLALCALINRFRPDLIDFYSLSPENIYYNNDLAYRIAEKEFGIPQMLDAQDMVTMAIPDRLSMATYLSAFYDYFKNQPMLDPPEKPKHAALPVSTPLSVSDTLKMADKTKVDFKDCNNVIINNRNKSLSTVSNRADDTKSMEIGNEKVVLGNKMSLKTKCDLTTFEEVRVTKPSALIQAAVNVEISVDAPTLRGKTISEELDSAIKGQFMCLTEKCNQKDVVDVVTDKINHKTKFVRTDENIMSSIHGDRKLETDVNYPKQEKSINYIKMAKNLNYNGTEPDLALADKGDGQVLAVEGDGQFLYLQHEQTLSNHICCIDKTDPFAKLIREVNLPPQYECDERSDSCFNSTTETITSEVITNNGMNLSTEIVDSLNNDLSQGNGKLLSEELSDRTDTKMETNTTERGSFYVRNESSISDGCAKRKTAATVDNMFKYISSLPEFSLEEVNDNFSAMFDEIKSEPSTHLDDEIFKYEIQQHHDMPQDMIEAINPVHIENIQSATSEFDCPPIETCMFSHVKRQSILGELKLDLSENGQNKYLKLSNDIYKPLLNLDSCYSVSIPCKTNCDLARHESTDFSSDHSNLELDCEPPLQSSVGPPNLLKEDTLVCVPKTTLVSSCSDDKCTKDKVIYHLEHSSTEDDFSSVYQKKQQNGPTEVKLEHAVLNTSENNIFKCSSKNIRVEPKGGIYVENGDEDLSSSQIYYAEPIVIQPPAVLLCENIKVGNNSCKASSVKSQLEVQHQSEALCQSEAQLQSPCEVLEENCLDKTKCEDNLAFEDLSTFCDNSVNEEKNIERKQMQSGEVKLDNSLNWVKRILTKQTQSGEVDLECLAAVEKLAEHSLVKEEAHCKELANVECKKHVDLDVDSKKTADVTLRLLRKAAIMSKEKAETLKNKMGDTQADKMYDLTATSKNIPNYATNQMQSESAPSADLDRKVKEAHRMAVFQQLKCRARPTKNTINVDESVSSNSSLEKAPAEFKNKIRNLDKKSAINVEPDAPESGSNKQESFPNGRISLSSVKPCTSTPKTYKQKHLLKLNEHLPAMPAPGSLADYVKRISQKSLTQKIGERVLCTASDKDQSSKIRKSWRDVPDSLTGLQPKQQMDSGLSNALPSDDKIQEECIKPESISNAKCAPSSNIQISHKDNNKSDFMLSEESFKRSMTDVTPPIFCGRIIHKHIDRQLVARPVSLNVDFENCKEKLEHVIEPSIPLFRHFSQKERSRVDMSSLNKIPDRPLGIIEIGNQEEDSNSKIRQLDCHDILEKDNKIDVRRKAFKNEQLSKWSLSLTSIKPNAVAEKDNEHLKNNWQKTKIKRSDFLSVRARPLSLQVNTDNLGIADKRQLRCLNSALLGCTPIVPVHTKYLPNIPVQVKPLTENKHLNNDSKNKHVTSSDRDGFVSNIDCNEEMQDSIEAGAPDMNKICDELVVISNVQIKNDEIAGNIHNCSKSDEQKEVLTSTTHLDNVISFTEETVEEHKNLNLCCIDKSVDLSESCTTVDCTKHEEKMHEICVSVNLQFEYEHDIESQPTDTEQSTGSKGNKKKKRRKEKKFNLNTSSSSESSHHSDKDDDDDDDKRYTNISASTTDSHTPFTTYRGRNTGGHERNNSTNHDKSSKPSDTNENGSMCVALPIPDIQPANHGIGYWLQRGMVTIETNNANNNEYQIDGDSQYNMSITSNISNDSADSNYERALDDMKLDCDNVPQEIIEEDISSLSISTKDEAMSQEALEDWQTTEIASMLDCEFSQTDAWLDFYIQTTENDVKDEPMVSDVTENVFVLSGMSKDADFIIADNSKIFATVCCFHDDWLVNQPITVEHFNSDPPITKEHFISDQPIIVEYFMSEQPIIIEHCDSDHAIGEDDIEHCTLGHPFSYLSGIDSECVQKIFSESNIKSQSVLLKRGADMNVICEISKLQPNEDVTENEEEENLLQSVIAASEPFQEHILEEIILSSFKEMASIQNDDKHIDQEHTNKTENKMFYKRDKDFKSVSLKKYSNDGSIFDRMKLYEVQVNKENLTIVHNEETFHKSLDTRYSLMNEMEDNYTHSSLTIIDRVTSSSTVDSSDDCYSDVQLEQKVKHILPEHNVTSTRLEDVEMQTNGVIYDLSDVKRKHSTVKMQLCLIPDMKVTPPFYPTLKDDNILTTSNGISNRDIVLTKDTIISMEQDAHLDNKSKELENKITKSEGTLFKCYAKIILIDSNIPVTIALDWDFRNVVSIDEFLKNMIWKNHKRKTSNFSNDETLSHTQKINDNISIVESHEKVKIDLSDKCKYGDESSSVSSKSINKISDTDYSMKQMTENQQFLIGREKEPNKSEVAQLIQQSLELDRRYDELHRSEHKFIQRLQPSDENLEHNHQQLMPSLSSDIDDNVNLDESSDEDDMHDQELSEELHMGEATPLPMPPGKDNKEDLVSTPEECDSVAVVEVPDLPDHRSSSPDDLLPDLASQALLVKLQEAQCKNSLIEAELTKLKGKLTALENKEGQKKMFKKKNEEMLSYTKEVEKSLLNARQEINHYQDMMKGAQEQYIALEKQMKDEYIGLEKKYHKAKRLIKEYQQREKDFIGERECLLQQQSEKDHRYDSLVKSLKDRIFQLDGELREAQKTAGLYVLQPLQSQTLEEHFVPVVSLAVKAFHAVDECHRDVVSPTDDKDCKSSESDITGMDTDCQAVTDSITVANSRPTLMFESVPKVSLLDISAQRTKALLAANLPRRLPTKRHMLKSQDREENVETDGESTFGSTGLNPWIIYDRDNTVKKSDLTKGEMQSTDYSDLLTIADKTVQFVDTHARLNSLPGTSVPIHLPPPAGALQSVIQMETMEPLMDRLDSESEDSESTISQTSYDPSQPNFLNRNSEIPGFDTISMDTIDTGNNGNSESSAGGVTKKFIGLLPKLPFKLGGNSDHTKSPVTLLSSRSLDGDDPNFSNNGRKILISKQKIDTGLDINGASKISDSSSGYMVGEIESTTYSFSGTPANQDHPSLPGHHGENQFQSGQITDWNNANVQHWLFGIEMEKYAPLFIEKSINGIQLIALDTIKLKAMGITNVKDRDYIKKKLKDLRFVQDKEKKQLEKQNKQIEKDLRAQEKEQLKISKKK